MCGVGEVQEGLFQLGELTSCKRGNDKRGNDKDKVPDKLFRELKKDILKKKETVIKYIYS